MHLLYEKIKNSNKVYEISNTSFFTVPLNADTRYKSRILDTIFNKENNEFAYFLS